MTPAFVSKLRVLDLFSGIGGFSLGLERTGGFETVAFCEIEPFPRKVLAKHWPDVPIYDDVRTLTAERLAADGIGVDVICGGFPCQDISLAGKGAGIEGERSGLWSEYARLIGELRPCYVIVENVAALLSRGLGRVLGDLAAIGFDAEWHCIPASAVGAPHRRDRLWIVAYPRSEQHEGDRAPFSGSLTAQLSNANANREREPQPQGIVTEIGRRARDVGCEVANAKGFGWSEGHALHGGGGAGSCAGKRTGLGRRGWWSAEPDLGRVAHGVSQELDGDLNAEKYFDVSSHPQQEAYSYWAIEPADTPRVAHGVNKRVDRLKGLGNAVVPQIPELIGNAILSARAA